jgi:threonine/homoserine/homoserine lactone efflux protein
LYNFSKKGTILDYLILISIGFIAAITPGPDIFYVIRNGLCKGKNAALIATLGILCGNILYLTLVGLGLWKIGQNGYFQLILGVIGGLYLLKVAFFIFKDKPKLNLSCNNLDKFAIFKEALFLNLSNPKAMIFFAIIVAPFMGKSLILSLIALFLAIASAFLLSAIISSKIKINEKILVYINKIASIVFVFFAISLFINAYEAYINL